MKKPHDLYVNNLVGDLRANPETSTGIQIAKKGDGSDLVESESDQTGEFNGQFSDVLTQSGLNEIPLFDRSAPQMNDIVIYTFKLWYL